MVENNLAAPCGLYCGICRMFLVLDKDQLEQRGFKKGCPGCRVRNKKCKWIRKHCAPIRTGEREFCHECEEMPCEELQIIEDIYQERYCVSLVENLKKIKEIGSKKWLKEQEKNLEKRVVSSKVALATKKM